MVSSLQLSYEEFDEVLAVADGRTRLTGPEKADFEIGSLSFGDADIQIMQEGAPNFYEGVGAEDQVSLCFSLPAPFPIVVSGVTLDEGHVVVIRPGQWVDSYTKGVCRYVMVNLPFDQVVEAVDLLDPSFTECIFGGPVGYEVRQRQTRRLSLAVGRMIEAEKANKRSGKDQSAKRLVDDYIKSFMEGIHDTSPSRRRAGRPRLSRRGVIGRIHEVINEASYFRYSVKEMAQYVGVSERTFHTICLERFGVSPKRWIRLRQMNDIHAALKRAPRDVKVSEVELRYGITEWGRFAANYKAVFGESPSETLKRY